MTADLRDKIAAALYYAYEYSGQGDPLWAEILANYGGEHEAVVDCRAMADAVLPIVENRCLDLESKLILAVRDRNYAMRQRDEERSAKEGNWAALKDQAARLAEAEHRLGAVAALAAKWKAVERDNSAWLVAHAFGQELDAVLAPVSGADGGSR